MTVARQTGDREGDDREADVTDDITYRDLDRSDGPALTAVNRACRIGADFSFYFERGADFFRWPDLVFDDARYVGIFRGDALRGYVMAARYRGFDGAGPSMLLYGGDARLLPADRGSRRSVQAAMRLLSDLPADTPVGYGLVKDGNAPADTLVRTTEVEGAYGRELVRFEVANIPLLRRIRPAGVCKVRRARPADAEAIAALTEGVTGRRPFAPLWSVERWDRFLRDSPGLGYERYYLAERDGRVVGGLAAWDRAEVLSTVVLGWPWWGPVLRTAWGLGRRAFRQLAPLPAAGEAFRALALTRVAVRDRDPGVLRDLVAAVAADHLGHGYHMLHVGLTMDDPLRRALDGIPRQRFRSRIHAMLRRGTSEAWPAERLTDPYVELAFL